MIRDSLDFGKYAFRPLEAVPVSYLSWVLREVDITSAFRSLLRQEIDRRKGRGARATDPPRSTSRAHPPVDWPTILGQVRRRLAMQHHPDRGGSIEKMAGINLAIDAVEREVAKVA